MSRFIHISATDNELILIAYQWTQSFHLCTIHSGNRNTVDVTISLLPGVYRGEFKLNGVENGLLESHDVHLPAGDYTLVGTGINWGGPTAFKFSLDGVVYEGSPPETKEGGVVWNTEPISLSIQ